MKAKAKTNFLHDHLGHVKAGDEIELTDEQHASIQDYVEVYDTKVVRQKPADKAEK